MAFTDWLKNLMSSFFSLFGTGHGQVPPPVNPQGGGTQPPIVPNPPPLPPPPIPPPCPTIVVSPTSLPNGAVGVPYSVTFTATGSNFGNAYIFTASGFLPAGLTLGVQGQLTGTPLVAGQTRLSITATDPGKCFGTVTAPIQIAPAPTPPCPSIFVTPTTIASGVTSSVYSQQMSATGGTAPYTFTSSTLPAGLSISSGGLISGTPTTAGSTAITVSVTDANSCPGSVLTTLVITVPPSPPGPQTGLKLLQSTGLTYLGAFRLPRGATGTDPDSFAFGCTAATFNSANGALIVAGMVPANGFPQSFAEISVPNPVITTDLTQLPYASLLSGSSLLNPIGSRITQVDPGGGTSNYIGGFALVGSNLIVSIYVYYDGSTPSATLSHFVLNGTPPYAYVGGPYQVGSKGAGWVAGPMCPVPGGISVGTSWLTGQCALAVIGRTSCGPSMSSFDPTQLGTTVPDPATLLVGYDLNTHMTLGAWDGTPAASPNPTLFNGATNYPGAVIIGRTLLFGGRLGNGTFCYGIGQNNPALQGQPGAPDSAFPNWCYDPTAGPPSNPSGPGTFDSSYANQLLAYDLNDLASVYAGSKSYWQVVPYANWSLTFPLGPAMTGITTMAADPSTGRLFIFQKNGDTYTPLVHVYGYTLT